MRPATLFLTAVVLGGLAAYLLTNGQGRVPRPQEESALESGAERAETRAAKAAGRERASKEQVEQVLRTALQARFPDKTFKDTDYRTLTDVVLRIRAAQRALRSAARDDTRHRLEDTFAADLESAVDEFRQVTGMEAAELSALLGSQAPVELGSQHPVTEEGSAEVSTAVAEASGKAAKTEAGDFLRRVLLSAAAATLLWLLYRSLASRSSRDVSGTMRHGTPILPTAELAAHEAAERESPSIAPATKAGAPASSLPLVARLDGEAISLQDIAKGLAVDDELVDDKLVDDQLLAREATRRSLSVDDLLQSVEAQASPVDDEDIAAYLTEHPRLRATPNSRERAAHCISLRRRIERRIQFRFSLRRQAKFELPLEPEL